MNDSQKNPKIVVIGGGTGIHSLLRGLKKYTNDIVAVVTMMDSGGSSGRLRDEFGHLPPGDIRQALVALSPSDRSSLVLRQLFNYRFSKGGGLEGHSFGNIFITGLTEVTGGIDKAIEEAGKILGIRGKVLPVTLSNSNLVARLVNGKEIMGEKNIDIRKENPDIKIDYIYLDPQAYAHKPVLEEIESADVIVLGPGDLYTSVLPNLLVDGVVEAINFSRAKKVYICNLMTKHGESDGFSASDFVKEVRNYLDEGELDYVVVNFGVLPEKIVQRYSKEKAYPVEVNTEDVKKLAKNVFAKPIASVSTLLRHDSGKIARIIVDISSK